MKQYTHEELNQMRISKGELFASVESTFDYALPQTWLDAFAVFCKVNHPLVTYDLIQSTTVWLYGNDTFAGRPLTVCSDVQIALDAMRS